MNCPECSKEIPDNTYHCPHCGEDIEKAIGTEKIRLSEPVPSAAVPQKGESHKACGCLLVIFLLLVSVMIAGTWYIIVKNSNSDAEQETSVEENTPGNGGAGPEDSF